jgi:hypothetical protein
MLGLAYLSALIATPHLSTLRALEDVLGQRLLNSTYGRFLYEDGRVRELPLRVAKIPCLCGLYGLGDRGL